MRQVFAYDCHQFEKVLVHGADNDDQHLREVFVNSNDDEDDINVRDVYVVGNTTMIAMSGKCLCMAVID